jgi:hypothetical protein
MGFYCLTGWIEENSSHRQFPAIGLGGVMGVRDRGTALAVGALGAIRHLSTQTCSVGLDSTREEGLELAWRMPTVVSGARGPARQAK